MRGIERRADGERTAAHDRDRAAQPVHRGLRRADAVPPQGLPHPPDRMARPGQRRGLAARPGAEGRQCGSHASPGLRAETNDSHGLRFHGLRFPGLRAAAARRRATCGYRPSPLRSEEAVPPTPTPPTLPPPPPPPAPGGTPSAPTTPSARPHLPARKERTPEKPGVERRSPAAWRPHGPMSCSAGTSGRTTPGRRTGQPSRPAPPQRHALLADPGAEVHQAQAAMPSEGRGRPIERPAWVSSV